MLMVLPVIPLALFVKGDSLSASRLYKDYCINAGIALILPIALIAGGLLRKQIGNKLFFSNIGDYDPLKDRPFIFSDTLPDQLAPSHYNQLALAMRSRRQFPECVYTPPCHETWRLVLTPNTMLERLLLAGPFEGTEAEMQSLEAAVYNAKSVERLNRSIPVSIQHDRDTAAKDVYLTPLELALLCINHKFFEGDDESLLYFHHFIMVMMIQGACLSENPIPELYPILAFHAKWMTNEMAALVKVSLRMPSNSTSSCSQVKQQIIETLKRHTANIQQEVGNTFEKIEMPLVLVNLINEYVDERLEMS